MTSRSRRHDWRGLSPNTSYDVRVRAVSAAGNGAWSDVGRVTTPGGIQQTHYNIFHRTVKPLHVLFPL